ncbi:MAG TPA: ABC transporter substrate-binding protein, partial [Naasia sp.]
MMRKRSRPALLAAIASASVLLAGCTTTSGNGGSGGGDGAATDTIRTTIDIPSGFDPTQALSLPDFVLGHVSYDTLVRRDESGVIGGLATEWETTPNSATFTLRDDAVCADGTEITPTIVKDSLDYYVGSSASGTATVFGPGNTITVTADDSAGTVTVDLSGPWPDLLNGLTIGSTGIICPAGLADPEALAAGEATGAESGPYVLESAEAGVRYTYTLRDDYAAWPEWSGIEGTPAKTIEFVVSPDSSATANLVLSGQLDIAKIQAESMSRFDGMDDHEITVNRFSDFYVIFNQRESSPFTDPALRKAVAQVLDREAFENITSSGTGEISGNMVAADTQCAVDNTANLIPLDPEAAAGVLDGVTIRIVGPQIMGPAGAGNEYAQEVLRAAGA